MVLIHIFRGYTITNLILDSSSVRSTPLIKSLKAWGIQPKAYGTSRKALTRGSKCLTPLGYFCEPQLCASLYSVHFEFS